MNKHAYTDYKTSRTVTQSLPPGRFLGQNEVLEENDLALETRLPFRKTRCAGKFANAVSAGAPRYYRPVAPVANKTHTHVYQKTETVTEPLPEGRFLNERDTLLSGDLYLPSGGPSEPVIECNVGSPVDFNESWYRPEPVKAEEKFVVEKWRLLKEGEIIQDGDEACMENGTFKPSRWVGDKFGGRFLPIRRKVSADKVVKPTPKKKYVAISGETLIRKGDQFYSKVTRGWRNVSNGIGRSCNVWPSFRIRRPVK